MAAVAIGPFVRFAVAGGAIAYQNWDTIRATFDRVKEDVPGPILGYYVQHVFEAMDSSGTFSTRERGMCGVHWLNSTGGDPDTTWTSADYALVEAGFATLWSTIAARLSTDVRLVEHRWYAFGPGVTPPNPPSRVTTLGTPSVGTGGVSTPHQTACTITFRTGLRRHWGRIYLPVWSNSWNSAGGTLSTANVDIIAAAGSAYVKSGVANGLTPCVYDRTRHVALGITAVECDSVPDIIRRRRTRTTNYRKILTS